MVKLAIKKVAKVLNSILTKEKITFMMSLFAFSLSIFLGVRTVVIDYRKNKSEKITEYSKAADNLASQMLDLEEAQSKCIPPTCDPMQFGTIANWKRMVLAEKISALAKIDNVQLTSFTYAIMANNYGVIGSFDSALIYNMRALNENPPLIYKIILARNIAQIFGTQGFSGMQIDSNIRYRQLSVDLTSGLVNDIKAYHAGTSYQLWAAEATYQGKYQMADSLSRLAAIEYSKLSDSYPIKSFLLDALNSPRSIRAQNELQQFVQALEKCKSLVLEGHAARGNIVFQRTSSSTGVNFRMQDGKVTSFSGQGNLISYRDSIATFQFSGILDTAIVEANPFHNTQIQRFGTFSLKNGKSKKVCGYIDILGKPRVWICVS